MNEAASLLPHQPAFSAAAAEEPAPAGMEMSLSQSPYHTGHYVPVAFS